MRTASLLIIVLALASGGAHGKEATKPKKAAAPFSRSGGEEVDANRQLEYEQELEERAALERQQLAEERQKQIARERDELEREREASEREKAQSDELKDRELAEQEKQEREQGYQKARAGLEEEERAFAQQPQKARKSKARSAGVAPKPGSPDALPADLFAERRRSNAATAPAGGDPADLFLPDELREPASEPAAASGAPLPAGRIPYAPAEPPPAAKEADPPLEALESAAAAPDPGPPATAAPPPPPPTVAASAAPAEAEALAPLPEAAEGPAGQKRRRERDSSISQARARRLAAEASNSDGFSATTTHGRNYFSPLHFAFTVDYANVRYMRIQLDSSGTQLVRDCHGVHVGIEWLPIKTLGKVALGVGGAFITMPKASTPVSESVQLTFVPLDAGISYRFDYLRHQILVPFVKVGISLLSLSTQTVSSTGTATSTPSSVYLGLDTSLGLAINLRRVGPGDSVILDRDYGVNDVYLVAEMLYSKSLNQGTGPDLEHREFRGGIRLEF